MNKWKRNLYLILIAIFLISSSQCNQDRTKKKELLIGDWLVIGGKQWIPGYRFTQDSIIPLLGLGYFATSPRPELGERYELTMEDSLLFGPPEYLKNRRVKKTDFCGSWKIKNLSQDSLTIEDYSGLVNFYKK